MPESSAKKMEIRKPLRTDVTAMMRLFSELEVADPISFEFKSETQSHCRNVFEDEKNGNLFAGIAIIDGEIAGFGGIRRYPILRNDGEIYLGLFPQYRRLGYGKRIVQYLLTRAYEKSIADIYAKVHDQNTQALEFFRKIGFDDFGADEEIINDRPVTMAVLILEK